jgi:HSP20 family protein
VKNKVNELKGLSFFCVERTYGTFARKFRIVSPVDKKKIDAAFKNGVLTITLPKK